MRRVWGPQRARSEELIPFCARQEDMGHDPIYLQKDSSEEKGMYSEGKGARLRGKGGVLGGKGGALGGGRGSAWGEKGRAQRGRGSTRGGKGVHSEATTEAWGQSAAASMGWEKQGWTEAAAGIHWWKEESKARGHWVNSDFCLKQLSEPWSKVAS